MRVFPSVAVASAIEINVSSPNTPGLRNLQEAKVLDDLLARAIDARDRVRAHAGPVPVLLKIAPDLTLADLYVSVANHYKEDHFSQYNTAFDIWFDPMPPYVMTAQEREDRSATSYIKSGTNTKLRQDLWTDAHSRMIKRAASYPEVERIFVNAGVKKELCDSAGKDRAWLRKVRPWYLHDDHLHVRPHGRRILGLSRQVPLDSGGLRRRLRGAHTVPQPRDAREHEAEASLRVQPQQLLGDDVALDLRGAGRDRAAERDEVLLERCPFGERPRLRRGIEASRALQLRGNQREPLARLAAHQLHQRLRLKSERGDQGFVDGFAFLATLHLMGVARDPVGHVDADHLRPGGAEAQSRQQPARAVLRRHSRAWHSIVRSVRGMDRRRGRHLHSNLRPRSGCKHP